MRKVRMKVMKSGVICFAFLDLGGSSSDFFNIEVLFTRDRTDVFFTMGG